MTDVVISFHSSMSATDWKGRQLKSMFKPGTVFIDGGSGVMTSGGSYDALIAKYTAMVPRSPSDPRYVPSKPSTHTRKSFLKPFIRAHAPQIGENEPCRVAIVGFSEGCQGVNAFVKSSDIGYIDTVVAIDGIHWLRDRWFNKKTNQWSECKENSLCFQTLTKHWLDFAALAAFGRPPDAKQMPDGSRCCVITNSSIPAPPCCRQAKYASEYIVQRVLGSNVGPMKSPPEGIINMAHNPPLHFNAWSVTDKSTGKVIDSGPALDYPMSQSDWYAAYNNLWVFSYKDLDVGGSGHWDHVYQAKVVLPLMLEKIVIPRMMSRTAGTFLEI